MDETAPEDPAPGANPTPEPESAPEPVDVDRVEIPEQIDVDVQVEEAVPDELPSTGEASEVPAPFFWALWVAVFAVILWGMLLLFRGRTPDDH